MTFREAGYVNASMQKANTLRLRANRDNEIWKNGWCILRLVKKNIYIFDLLKLCVKFPLFFI